MPVTTSDPNFLPVDNELPLRLLRWLRLVPREGLGTVRRAIFLTLLAWCPIVLWAAATGRLQDRSSESLLAHHGVNVRCLVAIPLLVLAEPALQRMAQRITRLLISGGLVDTGPDSTFTRLANDMRALRDKSVQWVIVLGLTVVWIATGRPSPNDDALSWAIEPGGAIGFGGYWFAYVGRAIFVALVLAWLWRILMVTWWFWRISRLDLSIVPTHPDKAGGLAFFDKVPGSFALVTFVLSTTLAAHWAHEILAHGAKIEEFKFPAMLFAVLWTAYLLLPLLVFAPKLKKTKSAATASYSALVGQQGRLVHRQWVLHEPVPEDEPILEAPGIGVIADAAAMFEAVKKMRLAPIGSKTILRVLVPMALPFIAVAALQIPFKDLLLKLLKALA